MPEFDLTITVSVILAICAIVSPIFTALINNWFQIRMKKLEFIQNVQIKDIEQEEAIFQKYLTYAGKAVHIYDLDSLETYSECAMLAIAYSEEPLAELILEIDNHIYHEQYNEAYDKLKHATSLISERILILRTSKQQRLHKWNKLKLGNPKSS